MAWAGNSGIADNLFPGATVNNGIVTIPSGRIISYSPAALSVDTDPDGGASDFVFGMCETMHSGVSAAALTNVTSQASSNLSGSTLTKTYSFTVSLNFNEAAQVEMLNVKDNT